MLRHVVISTKLILLSTVLLGLFYPWAITGIAQVVWPDRANGSLVERNGCIVGSMLIGQAFSRPEYFHPRPSAAGEGYDASASAGSNLGPTSRVLRDRVSADVRRLIRENPGLRRGAIPVDMVTASASGLDPDISPANAYSQAARVAAVRGMTLAEMRNLIRENTTPRQFGILGEPRVNVLRLNMALQGLP
ncbi:MAG: potassium-transporting ATPase subunit KdpC [Armatimonadetes bacterium]|nr:potassium-transporting ATPase subunit KdpC [Armatimonadota bacterium]